MATADTSLEFSESASLTEIENVMSMTITVKMIQFYTSFLALSSLFFADRHVTIPPGEFFNASRNLLSKKHAFSKKLDMISLLKNCNIIYSHLFKSTNLGTSS